MASDTMDNMTESLRRTMKGGNMQIANMNDAETKEHLLKWCDNPDLMPFAWPTDACGYDQHIKFVMHRNEHWKGNTHQDFVDFVRQYAVSLEPKS